MNYKLTEEQELRFNDLVERMQEKVFLALYKCNIQSRYYNEFYSFALEGLLVSFLLLEKGEILQKDFEKFSFVTMKRKIIDELRRRNREQLVPIDKIENLKLFESGDYKIEELEFLQSVETNFNEDEIKIFKFLLAGMEQKEIFKKLKVSKSKGYNIIRNIREKCTTLVYKN